MWVVRRQALVAVCAAAMSGLERVGAPIFIGAALAVSCGNAPVASAGPDQYVVTGSLVALDGSASSDPDGDALTYAWSFVSRPAGSSAALSDATAVAPTFTPDVDGSYTLSLVVSDGSNVSVADTVIVTATTPSTGLCAFVQGSRPPAAGVVLLPDGHIMTIGNDPSAPIAVTALIRAGADGSDIQRLDLIWYFLGRAIALQSDGRVVVAGSSKESTTDSNRHVMLQRYDQDGVLDVSFGVNGTVRYGAITEDASAVAIQPDGKILVGGTSSDGSRSHALLLRYDGDGVLDGSFGNGGVVTYDPGTNGSAGVDIALQPDGKILLSGTTAAATRDVLLLRYNPNGSLDQTFGTNGAATYDSGDEDWGFGLALQPDGRIVLVGQHVVSGNGYALLLRYDASGSPDATFGTGGAITSVQGIARDVAVASDGKLVVAGDTFSPGIVFSVALVAKYNPDGTPDTSFGQDGIVAYDATGAVDHANALALLADGSVVAVGAANHTFGLGGGSPGDLLVMKLYDVCQ